MIVQGCRDDIPRAIDAHTDVDLDDATNRLARSMRYLGNFLMKHPGDRVGSGRRRSPPRPPAAKRPATVEASSKLSAGPAGLSGTVWTLAWVWNNRTPAHARQQHDNAEGAGGEEPCLGGILGGRSSSRGPVHAGRRGRRGCRGGGREHCGRRRRCLFEPVYEFSNCGTLDGGRDSNIVGSCQRIPAEESPAGRRCPNSPGTHAGGAWVSASTSVMPRLQMSPAVEISPFLASGGSYTEGRAVLAVRSPGGPNGVARQLQCIVDD